VQIKQFQKSIKEEIYLLLLKIYILISLISAVLAYTSLHFIPQLKKQPTFYQILKIEFEKEGIKMSAIKVFLIFLLTFTTYSLVWFISIPISLRGIIASITKV
jgi:hypothetical protein